MAEKGIMSGYDQLASAIVQQACLDYAELAERLYFHNDLTLLNRDKVSLNEIKDFFHSDWFRTLSDLDGDELLKGAQTMAKKRIMARLKNGHKQAVSGMMKKTAASRTSTTNSTNTPNTK